MRGASYFTLLSSVVALYTKAALDELCRLDEIEETGAEEDDGYDDVPSEGASKQILDSGNFPFHDL